MHADYIIEQIIPIVLLILNDHQIRSRLQKKKKGLVKGMEGVMVLVGQPLAKVVLLTTIVLLPKKHWKNHQRMIFKVPAHQKTL